MNTSLPHVAGPSATTSSVWRRLPQQLRSFEWLVIITSILGAAGSRYLPVDPTKLAAGRITEGFIIGFVIILSLRAVLPLRDWWPRRNLAPPGELSRCLGHYYRPGYVVYVLRAALAWQITMLWFCCIKYALPVFRPHFVDGALWKWDRLLHLGISPSEWIVSLSAAKPWLLKLADSYYVFYFPLVLLFFTYVMVQERRSDLRDRFVWGYCFFWLIGGLSYYVWPSMGPIYYRPELFSQVIQHMPAAAELQQELLVDHRAFLVNPWLHEPMLYYGIAAMPSLHVGACAFVTAFAWHLNKPAFWLAILLTILMFVCSVMTGWHYAIDGYAGALLAWACYAVAMRTGRSSGGNNPKQLR